MLSEIGGSCIDRDSTGEGIWRGWDENSLGFSAFALGRFAFCTSGEPEFHCELELEGCVSWRVGLGCGLLEDCRPGTDFKDTWSGEPGTHLYAGDGEGAAGKSCIVEIEGRGGCIAVDGAGVIGVYPP